MKRPIHTTPKARSKAAAARMQIRHWLNGPDGKSLMRSVMDRVLERTLDDYYGVTTKVENGRLVQTTWANGQVSHYA